MHRKNAKIVYRVMKVISVRGKRKERIRTEQVTDQERSTNVNVTDV